MKYIYTGLIGCMCFFACKIGVAQNVNSMFLYQMNHLNINPAKTGDTDGLEFIMNPGTQWVGLNGNPTNSMFGGHTRLNKQMGVGGKMVIDNRSFFSNLTMEGLYSYMVQLTESQKITFGVNAGFFQTKLNNKLISENKYNDQADPNISAAYYNNVSMLAGAGLMYEWNNLEVALSNPFIIVSGDQRASHFYFSSTYKFEESQNNLSFQPQMVFQSIASSPDILDLGMKVSYSGMFWGQYTYRSNRMNVISAGVNWREAQVGYSYAMTQAPISSVSSGSHEIFLAYTLKKKNKASKKSSAQNVSIKKDKVSQLRVNALKMSKLDLKEKDVTNELEDIFKELSVLVDKLKINQITELEKKRIDELEKRIQEIKNKEEVKKQQK